MEESSSVVAEPNPQAETRSPQGQQNTPSQGQSPQSPAGQAPIDRPPTDNEARSQRRSAILNSPRTKWGLIVAGLVLLVAVFFLWRYLGSYESTDDAQIDGHVNAVSARVSGHS